jgi:hypothetical protein
MSKLITKFKKVLTVRLKIIITRYRTRQVDIIQIYKYLDLDKIIHKNLYKECKKLQIKVKEKYTSINTTYH